MTDSLGNTTEFASAGEFAEKYGTTALRFWLLSVARKILPNERIQICWRYPLPQRTTVDLIYSEERQRARSVGTMKCGNGWMCPCCSVYIGERRRVELGTALERAREKYAPVMITYTARHDQGMRLQPLMSQMQNAFSNLKRGRWWQDLKSEFGLVGSVRATEVTYGEAGWHPHYHEIMLIDLEVLTRDFDGALAELAAGLREVMVKRWLYHLEKVGLDASKERGLDIRSADDDIAEYVVKYGKLPENLDYKGSADEIARGMSKSARGRNFSPWEILFKASYSKKHERLFVEYVNAVGGRSQLQWSRGTKALLGVNEIRDEIAAEGAETETDRLLASIDAEMWRLIAERGHLAQLMTFANSGEDDRVKWLLEKIKERYKVVRVELHQFDLGH